MPVITSESQLPDNVLEDLNQKSNLFGGIPKGSFTVTLDKNGKVSSVASVRSGNFSDIHNDAKLNKYLYLIDRRSRV